MFTQQRDESREKFEIYAVQERGGTIEMGQFEEKAHTKAWVQTEARKSAQIFSRWGIQHWENAYMESSSQGRSDSRVFERVGSYGRELGQYAAAFARLCTPVISEGIHAAAM